MVSRSFHLINGDDVSSGTWFDVYSPEDGLLVSQGSRCTDEIVNQALSSAEAAFSTWRHVPYVQRRNLLLTAADRLEGRGEEIKHWMMKETGAKADWSLGANVHGASALLREVASLASQVKGEVLASNNPGTTTFVTREPCGVVLGIAPWNSPIVLSCRAVAIAILCGNTVILKSSECSPLTQRFVAEAFRDAGFPDGVLNYLNMAPDETPSLIERIISHRCVRRVNFTGSLQVGQIIAKHCATYGPKPCVLELAGKAPAIVLADANLDAAADDIVFSSMMHSGQICFSIENVIACESIADVLVEKLRSRMAKLWAGPESLSLSDESKPEKFRLSPLYNKTSAARAVHLLQESVELDQVAIGDGKATDCYVSPHLINGLDPSTALFREESFAPFCAVIRVKSVDEAIRLANLSDYSLSAAVFGTDGADTFHVAREIRSGAVHINGPTLSFESNRPYGGCGGPSGYGRFGGTAGINEYTDLKVITLNKPGCVRGAMI